MPLEPCVVSHAANALIEPRSVRQVVLRTREGVVDRHGLLRMAAPVDVDPFDIGVRAASVSIAASRHPHRGR